MKAHKHKKGAELNLTFYNKKIIVVVLIPTDNCHGKNMSNICQNCTSAMTNNN